MRDWKYIEKEKQTRKTGIGFKALVERLSLGRIHSSVIMGRKKEVTYQEVKNRNTFMADDL